MAGLKYTSLSESLQEKIQRDREESRVNPYFCPDSAAIRRDPERDKPNLWRPAFVRDIEKILHLPFYNRYADKTQVFSFYHNDDITRRALHVQLVSRIARNIGQILGLNLDLIEAISLGHDIGHTPFGHAGERFLNELLYEQTGRYFAHNVHSVRVLETLFARNISLQTLDGILCHNGEFAQQEYRPCPPIGFTELEDRLEDCYLRGPEAIHHLVPSTLEACVVRICDMIAYLGKDRQDAEKAHIIDSNTIFSKGEIGDANAQIINNLVVDLIENSYGKNYLLLSENAYQDMKTAKEENNKYIYRNQAINEIYEETVKPMFRELYFRLLFDAVKKDHASILYRHHISFINQNRKYYGGSDYELEEPNQIVTDYLASMTDDYFTELHKFLFPNSPYRVEYISYFC